VFSRGRARRAKNVDTWRCQGAAVSAGWDAAPGRAENSVQKQDLAGGGDALGAAEPSAQ
jgi:hypothetical protein